MPEEHAGNRVFAFFFDGRVPKAANRGAQAFDRLVPKPEGFSQSMFQDFSLGIECFLDRGRNLGFAKI